MRKSFILRILLSITIITFIISCIKEKEIGCNDPTAVNYDPDATSIPGSDVITVFTTFLYDFNPKCRY